jgi:hypothetical protein
MGLTKRARYLERVFRAYLVPGQSHLTFWHETPAVNSRARFDQLGEYYMTFAEKAEYPGHYDSSRIPMLDYKGHIGLQYNPIAIAQYGLGNYNRYRQSGALDAKEKFLRVAGWLRDHLEKNPMGVSVWTHAFDWEYRDTLKAPWYSGLAQGQGISLLVRAHADDPSAGSLEAATCAFESFQRSVNNGGVMYTDERGDRWIEEYLVDPPTHILNGFIWAAWGVFDYWLATREDAARDLFSQVTRTLLRNLEKYDIGFWSLYEQSGTRLKMVASPFYHQLHIVQLRIMAEMTSENKFRAIADRWDAYARSRVKRAAAIGYKSAFKLCYY